MNQQKFESAQRAARLAVKCRSNGAWKEAMRLLREASMLDRHCPIDRDERIYADNWQDEPTEEDIERQRSIIEAQADLEEMYKYEL